VLLVIRRHMALAFAAADLVRAMMNRQGDLPDIPDAIHPTFARTMPGPACRAALRRAGFIHRSRDATNRPHSIARTRSIALAPRFPLAKPPNPGA
jgi:hypothetical protein